MIDVPTAPAGTPISSDLLTVNTVTCKPQAHNELLRKLLKHERIAASESFTTTAGENLAPEVPIGEWVIAAP